MKLGSGVCRVPEMLSLGIPVSLAVDGSASNDASNLMEEMRVCYLMHRLKSSYDEPSGYDVLRIATRGGAEVLGMDAIGSLEPGKATDFFMIRPDRLALVGESLDSKAMLSCVGFNVPVDLTVINGAVVVEDGHLAKLDEAALFQVADKEMRAYLGRR